MERSLEQAKLQRQGKMQEEDPDTGSEPQSTTDTASLPSSQKKTEQSVEMKDVGQDGPNIKPKPAPIETNLDDPYVPDEADPTQTSDTVALLGNGNKEKTKIKHKEAEQENPSAIISSDDEATLLDE